MIIKRKLNRLDELFTSLYKEDPIHQYYATIKTSVRMINNLEGKINWATAKIAVLFDVSLLWVIYERVKAAGGDLQNVTYFCSFKEKDDFAKLLEIKSQYIDYKKWLKGKCDMKFDAIVGNPPYLKGTHLKFFQKSLDILTDNGQMVFIHPADWIVVYREGKTKQGYDLIKDRLDKVGGSLTLGKAKTDFGFNIGMFIPLVITYVDTTAKGWIYENKIDGVKAELQSLQDIPYMGNMDTIRSIQKKIKDKSLGGINAHVKKEKKPYYVNLISICSGGAGGEAGFLSTYYDGTIHKNVIAQSLVNTYTNKVDTEPGRTSFHNGNNATGKERNWVSFDTEDEATNFLGYLTRTYFTKFIAALYQQNQDASAAYASYPWMPDWTCIWDDDKIGDFFGFTQEEQELIKTIALRVLK